MGVPGVAPPRCRILHFIELHEVLKVHVASKDRDRRYSVPQPFPCPVSSGPCPIQLQACIFPSFPFVTCVPIEVLCVALVSLVRFNSRWAYSGRILYIARTFTRNCLTSVMLHTLGFLKYGMCLLQM